MVRHPTFLAALLGAACATSWPTTQGGDDDSEIDASPDGSIDASPDGDPRGPDAMACAGASCYVVFDLLLDWGAAREHCATLGADLATIADPAENDLVNALIPDGNPWIGASDHLVETSWRWVTLEPFGYTNWDDGQPNNQTGDEDCLILRSGAGRWNDDECANPHRFVCERQP